MRPSLLNYSAWDSRQFATSFFGRSGACYGPVFNWLYFGKLPISQYVNPSYANQNITSGQINRYLTNVYVSRIPVVTSNITLAVGAVATYSFTGANSVITSSAATATATIASGVVTITGVAAGTSTVTISDISGNVIATITVTVA